MKLYRVESIPPWSLIQRMDRLVFDITMEGLIREVRPTGAYGLFEVDDCQVSAFLRLVEHHNLCARRIKRPSDPDSNEHKEWLKEKQYGEHN